MKKSIFGLSSQQMASPPSEVLEGRNRELAPDALVPIEEGVGWSDDLVGMDHELVRQLFAEGLKKEWANDKSDDYQLDRWLAPRLHSAIRVPRRVASDRSFWAWIAMAFGAEYVASRFPKDEAGRVSSWRFTGEALRNGVSRLWWAAELLRNGQSYAAVSECLKGVRVAEFALELKYSWYRPAAIAFVNVATSGKTLRDEELEALSRRANAYFPLTPVEAVGFDEFESAIDRDWWEGQTTLESLLEDDEVIGPRDGAVGQDAVRSMAEWFQSVLQEVAK